MYLDPGWLAFDALIVLGVLMALGRVLLWLVNGFEWFKETLMVPGELRRNRKDIRRAAEREVHRSLWDDKQ